MRKSERGSYYRNYLLSRGFWTKKKSDRNVLMRHDMVVGGIYAFIKLDPKGVEIVVDGQKFFFNNFDKLDNFFDYQLQQMNIHVEMNKILKRKLIGHQLKKLEI